MSVSWAWVSHIIILVLLCSQNLNSRFEHKLYRGLINWTHAVWHGPMTFTHGIWQNKELYYKQNGANKFRFLFLWCKHDYSENLNCYYLFISYCSLVWCAFSSMLTVCVVKTLCNLVGCEVRYCWVLMLFFLVSRDKLYLNTHWDTGFIYFLI